MATPDGHLRASDVERERVIEALRRHTADGRLSLEEFEDRVGEALSATTRDDLRPVLRDLPALPPDAPARTQPRRGAAWGSTDLGRAVLPVAAVIATVVLVASSGWALWWLVFPLMAAFGGCGRSRSCSIRAAEARQVRASDTAVDDELVRV